MFGKRKRLTEIPYDKSGKTPVIRSSICTGEQVAGFRDPSGKFKVKMAALSSDWIGKSKLTAPPPMVPGS